MDFAALGPLVDVLETLIAVLGFMAAGVATLWAFFRKQIKVWWAPYRAAVDSMADIPGIKHSVDQGRVEIQLVGTQVKMLTLVSRVRADGNHETAEFESAVDGSNTYVNQTYARWLGVGKNELLGWRWLNYIHSEDVQSVREEWGMCRAQHRPYRQHYRMVAANGTEFNVETICIPVPDAPPAHSWVGTIRKIA